MTRPELRAWLDRKPPPGNWRIRRVVVAIVRAVEALRA